MRLITKIICLIGIALLACFPGVSTAQSSQASQTELWEQLEIGQAVALVRHAIAPGNGDPVNFSLDDCETQRNLSLEGHQQSQHIGALFRANGIVQAAVFTSQWCRCVDTANGLEFGDVEPLPMLNSFYQDRSTESVQTNRLRDWINSRLEIEKNTPILPAVLVSHQVNITALSGVYPASGEIVIVGNTDKQLVVLGTIRTR